MKTATILHRGLAVCAAITLCATAFPHSTRAGNAPRIDALHVARIATEYLATRGKDAPYLISIALEADAIASPKSSWVARFSRPILVEGNLEVGMRVKFDGSVSYLVEDKSGPRKRAVPPKF